MCLPVFRVAAHRTGQDRQTSYGFWTGREESKERERKREREGWAREASVCKLE